MVELVKQNFLKNKKLYQSIARKLSKIMDENVCIDHVGSTAIPNMFGKNIIDILIGAKDENQFKQITKKLVDAGYFASQNSKDNIYQFFASTEKESGAGDTHIHLVMLNTKRYEDFLVLKNYLLNNPSEALAYSNHKKQLIKKGITDRKEYRATKSDYVTSLIDRAKKTRSNG